MFDWIWFAPKALAPLPKLGGFAINYRKADGAPVRFVYTPQSDITVFELAQIIPLQLAVATSEKVYDYEEFILRNKLERHFPCFNAEAEIIPYPTKETSCPK